MADSLLPPTGRVYVLHLFGGRLHCFATEVQLFAFHPSPLCVSLTPGLHFFLTKTSTAAAQKNENKKPCSLCIYLLIKSLWRFTREKKKTTETFRWGTKRPTPAWSALRTLSPPSLTLSSNEWRWRPRPSSFHTSPATAQIPPGFSPRDVTECSFYLFSLSLSLSVSFIFTREHIKGIQHDVFIHSVWFPPTVRS